MITEFDSIFHENGFIFVNEMKKDIEAQMAARVNAQRFRSKLGHMEGKGKIRKMDKLSKRGRIDRFNHAISNRSGGPNKLHSAEFFNKIESQKQEERAKKKEQKSNEESALMESIELI